MIKNSSFTVVAVAALALDLRANAALRTVVSSILLRRGVLGLAIKLDDEWFTVIGVMPAEFQFPLQRQAEVWLPLRWTPTEWHDRGQHNYSVVGRLRPGVSADAAREDLKAVARRYVAQMLDDEGRSVRVQPLRESIVGWARPILLTLTGAAGLLLAWLAAADLPRAGEPCSPWPSRWAASTA